MGNVVKVIVCVTVCWGWGWWVGVGAITVKVRYLLSTDTLVVYVDLN